MKNARDSVSGFPLSQQLMCFLDSIKGSEGEHVEHTTSHDGYTMAEEVKVVTWKM